MAILGGLFSKKDKSKAKPPSSITSTLGTDFDIESLDESDCDHTRLHPNTIYQNAGASSSKMKLPFRRSKSKVNIPATNTPSPTDIAHSSLQYSTQSEPQTGPLTPPQKSVPGGYGEPGSALTSKSLPNVLHTRSESHETVKTTVPTSTGKKSGRNLFSWVRDRKKSKPPPPPRPGPEGLKEESFNLRAFRHVGGLETVPGTPPLDDTTALFDLPPARPRPRGDSVASDASQRVSVAAFREMQARRSQAGSPSPQPTSRPTTLIESHRPDSPSLKQSTTSSTPASSNQPRSRNVAPRIVNRTSTFRVSPSNKSGSDSDSDHGPSPLSVQWRSKSELGHSSSPDHRSPNSPPVVSPQLRQGRATSDAPRPEKRPPMPVSVHAPARPAAIQSRSSSRPSVQNASPSAHNSSRPAKASDTSDSSDDSSDDDAPLATLVHPRRPGSAMSNSSGRSLPKPLIDIKSLGHSPLAITPVVSSVSSTPPIRSDTPNRSDTRSPTNINERLSNLAQGLTRHKPTSLVASETAPPDVLPSVEKKVPAPLTLEKENTSAHKPPANSTQDAVATSPSVNTTEFPTFKSPRASLSLDDPTPIKPTPIHHRTPQSGFSVMSRPPHTPTQSASMSIVQEQTEKGSEPLDSIGDFTAAMFSQLDMGFSTDEARESLDSTIKKSPAVTPKPTTPSAIPPKPISPAPGLTTRTPKIVKKKEPAAPARLAASDTPSPRLPPSSESTTSGRSVGRPRSSTLTAPAPSQTSQSPDSRPQPQPQPIPRKQPPRPMKSTPDVSARKATTTPQIQPPPISRHKRPPSSASTSSESSYESSSSAPSIAPRKQKQAQPQPRLQPTSRPRSATMGASLTAAPPSPTNSSNNSSSTAFNRPPQRPFAMRNNSPSSSTGDSSSGRLPVTPRDGSEIGSEVGRGARGKRQMFRAADSLDVVNNGLLSASNSEMGLKARKLSHRKSASYDDSTLKAAMKGASGMTAASDEDRRRERRRSEAKNAIELGKVMNGEIKLDDDDPIVGMDPRMSMMNPMMGMGMGMGLPQQTMPMMMGGPWMPQPNPMLQQFMPPPPQNTDSHLLAAHQHAMMVAKQAYQLAVAQQAMQAAGDEWERGSTLGWPSSASTGMFPAGPRSMYAGSIYGGSEYGGPSSGWATSSVYGGGFGPSTSNRNSAMIRNYQQNGPLPQRDSRVDLSSPNANSPEIRQPRPRVKTGPDPSDRPIATLMQQQQKGRGRTPPPPSSWKRAAKP